MNTLHLKDRHHWHIWFKNIEQLSIIIYISSDCSFWSATRFANLSIIYTSQYIVLLSCTCRKLCTVADLEDTRQKQIPLKSLNSHEGPLAPYMQDGLQHDTHHMTTWWHELRMCSSDSTRTTRNGWLLYTCPVHRRRAVAARPISTRPDTCGLEVGGSCPGIEYEGLLLITFVDHVH